MQIWIRTIPHSKQRYDTCGDWQFDPLGQTEILSIAVSETGDWRYNALVAVHELVEALLCKARGISEETVTAFDLAHPDLDDPGDARDAPYRREHRLATAIEMIMASELEVDWDEYADAIESLEIRRRLAAEAEERRR